MIRIKIHEAYRKVVAVCDSELLGKKFTEGKLQLDLKESFYGGEEMEEEKAMEIMKAANADDATFNIAGKNAVKAAVAAGVIDKKGIIKIQGIPHALGLL